MKKVLLASLLSLSSISVFAQETRSVVLIELPEVKRVTPFNYYYDWKEIEEGIAELTNEAKSKIEKKCNEFRGSLTGLVCKSVKTKDYDGKSLAASCAANCNY